MPTVSGYYSDSKTGHLLSLPFNSSTPVLYYNKDAFKKAGLDPEQPPKTWQDLADYAAKLKASGMKCGYASGWQGWIQLENFSAWNGLPFASKNNGFDGTDAVLEFNKPEQVKHIAMLEEMNKKGDFSYVGRKDESTEKFYNGDCAMTTASSGSLASIREYAKFNYGVGMMPYDADAKDAPQNAIIGGASLWVMQGKDKETYTGVAKFLDFLAKPENAAEWHQKTGYLPITKAAYDLTAVSRAFTRKTQGRISRHVRCRTNRRYRSPKDYVWATCRRSERLWMKSLRACGPVRRRHSRRWIPPLSVGISYYAALRNRRSLNQCNVGYVSPI